MHKLAAVLCLTLALVLAPYTVKLTADASGLPWKTFSESAKDATGAKIAACPGPLGQASEVLFATLVKDGVIYLYFYAPETGRFLFAQLGANGPEHLYIGQVDPSRYDDIRVSTARPFDANLDEGGPCVHLFPRDA